MGEKLLGFIALYGILLFHILKPDVILLFYLIVLFFELLFIQFF